MLLSNGVNSELRNLTNLEELFMDYSVLQNNFLQRVGELTSLKLLSLAGGWTSDSPPNIRGWTSDSPHNIGGNFHLSTSKH
ncbi:hypothetical protein QQP08_026671 [Theobroma cacao]|nr:hypothetical protein QQP08_026671 [Theobroma cacao]